MIVLASGRCLGKDSIGITDRNIVTGNDQLLLYSDGVPGSNTGSFGYTRLSKEEKKELAELTIDRWKKFGDI